MERIKEIREAIQAIRHARTTGSPHIDANEAPLVAKELIDCVADLLTKAGDRNAKHLLKECLIEGLKRLDAGPPPGQPHPSTPTPHPAGVPTPTLEEEG